MKHVFVVGSHTPYLTSLGVIEHLKLSTNEVIFIFGRNYKCNLLGQEYTSFDISEKYYIYLKGNTHKGIKEHAAWLDNFLDTHVGEPFVLYVPHLSFLTFQLFATHPLCKDVKFIQEGITDFCKPEPIHHKFSIKEIYVKTLLTKGTRIWSINLCWNDTSGLKDKTVSETFAISDRLFIDMHCKHTLVNWPRVDTCLSIEPGATLFVFESLVEQKSIEKEVFMEATRNLIKQYAGIANYVKFHPYQSKENIAEIIHLFQELNYSVKTLPDTIPFELILCSDRKYRVCGFTTSLIFYAALLGHDAHICAPALLISKKFKKYWDVYSQQLSHYGNVFTYENLHSMQYPTVTKITNKSELKSWIKLDFDSFQMKHPLLARFTYGENWELFSYMKNLRYLEYYINKKQYPWDKLLMSYHWLRHRKNCKRLDIYIAPNSVGPGFHLQHRGFRHILSGTKIGANCEILPLVLMGKKRPDIEDYHINIGNNCYISTGVTILAPINIGNNVTIAAGAVVTKDVPDNCIVAGVPAKIIKYK